MSILPIAFMVLTMLVTAAWFAMVRSQETLLVRSVFGSILIGCPFIGAGLAFKAFGWTYPVYLGAQFAFAIGLGLIGGMVMWFAIIAALWLVRLLRAW